MVFWKLLEIENEEGDEDTIPYLRYYNVFDIKQCEGIESKWIQKGHVPIEEGESIVKGFQDAPSIQHRLSKASYKPSTDTVTIPGMGDFQSSEAYYATLLHELIHSTGHSLNRDAVARDQISFGDHLYSEEELVAEIGAAMLCGVCGIDCTMDNSASYPALDVSP